MSLADPARRLAVDRVEAVGAYTLLRAAQRRGRCRPARASSSCCRPCPEPADAYLPRALSGGLGGRARDRLPARRPRRRHAGAGRRRARSSVLRAAGHGFAVADRPALLVGGGIGAAILPWLARELPQPPRVAARLPQRGACRLRGAGRPGRRPWCSSRCSSPSRWPGCCRSTASSTPAGRIRCCSAVAALAPSTTSRASWRWRRRWPAASAPATAARSRSTALEAAVRRGAGAGGGEDPGVSRRPAHVRSAGSTSTHPLVNGSGTLDALVAGTLGLAGLRHQDGDARTRARATRRMRIAETPAGMVNSIGLANPGLDRFCEEHLPRLTELGVPLIVERGRLVARASTRSPSPGSAPSPGGGRDRAQRLLPERRHGLHLDRHRRRRDAGAARALPRRDRRAAAGQAVAERGRRRARSPWPPPRAERTGWC